MSASLPTLSSGGAIGKMAQPPSTVHDPRDPPPVVRPPFTPRPVPDPKARVRPIQFFESAGHLLAQESGAGSVRLLWLAVGIGAVVVLLYVLVTVFFGWGKWKSSRQNIDMELEAGVRPRLDAFLREFAGKMKWNDESTERLCSAAEEAFMSLVRQDEAVTESGNRQLRVAIRRDGDAAEMEFMAAPQGTNLEEQMGLIRDRDTPMSGRDLSLRLLRHYASSVSHRQYHAIDLLTVRVKGSR